MIDLSLYQIMFKLQTFVVEETLQHNDKIIKDWEQYCFDLFLLAQHSPITDEFFKC